MIYLLQEREIFCCFLFRVPWNCLDIIFFILLYLLYRFGIIILIHQKKLKDFYFILMKKRNQKKIIFKVNESKNNKFLEIGI